jgi:hypothetical protein
MRILLNIILTLSISVWIVTAILVTATGLFDYSNETLTNVCGYSFWSMLFFGLEKVIVTDNKTKDSFKAYFSKEGRKEKRRVKKEKSKGCGCKK